jgi:hypothetical protein
MRQHRRIAFAAPFVLVVAAGCPKGKPTPKECAEIREHSACEAGQSCETDNHSCGLNGFTCRDGEWHALMTYCNPAAPQPAEPPPPAK